MKSIFYVLALIAIGGAAFLSNSNKGKMATVQEDRIAIQNRNETVSANRDKTQKELSVAIEELKVAKTEQAEAEASVDKLNSDAKRLKKELADVEGTLEKQAQELAQAKAAEKEALEIVEEMNLPGGGGIDAIPGAVTSLEDRKAELVQAIGEAETISESAEAAVGRNREEISRLAARKQERQQRFRQNAMSSVVTAVDQDWGFVVIGAGSRSGFTPQTRLIVNRGGRAIAEVKPSSIEATQTIAEIDWDTLAPGVRIQPGDRVILSKTNAN